MTRRAVAVYDASRARASLLRATAAGSSCGYRNDLRGPTRRVRGDNPTEDANARTFATQRADPDPDPTRLVGVVGWSDTDRRSSTPAAAKCRAVRTTCARPDVASTGSPVSPGDLPQRDVLE